MYDSLFQGCVAYYPGIIGSSGKYLDIIGGNDGTITGATKTGNDRFGTVNKCYDFTATGSKISLGNILNTTFAGSTAKFTIIVWINPIFTTLSNNTIIVAKDADNSFSENQRQFYLGINTTAKLTFLWFGALDASSYILNYSTTTLTSNSWKFIVITFDATQSTIVNKTTMYISSIKESISSTIYNSPTYIQTSTSHLGIGNILSSSGVATANQSFPGSIGEVMIFNTIKTPAEIKTIYDLTKLQYIMPKVGYWK